MLIIGITIVVNRDLNTLRPKQNGCHFADDVFKCIFLNENVWILFKISLNIVPKGPINNIPSLVRIMAWRRPGDKSLSEPMMVSLLTHICVVRPQWVGIETTPGSCFGARMWFCQFVCIPIVIMGQSLHDVIKLSDTSKRMKPIKIKTTIHLTQLCNDSTVHTNILYKTIWLRIILFIIFKGPVENSQVLTTICGEPARIDDVTSSGANIFVEFITDERIESSGFIIQVVSLQAGTLFDEFTTMA